MACEHVIGKAGWRRRMHVQNDILRMKLKKDQGYGEERRLKEEGVRSRENRNKKKRINK